MIRVWWAVIILGLCCMALPQLTSADEKTVATRYAIGGTTGLTYDPNNDYDFVQITGIALYDYETVWKHRAPEPLRFKIEWNAGITTAPQTRAMLSANFLALYYMNMCRNETLRPYVEAGIGVAYTDFQVHNQGLRVNFNPQIGMGTEIKSGERTWFTGFRFHHISNGGLHHDNRGVNSIVWQIGMFF
ncbi:MAG: acyloxyacyl hydrolase [Nitrospirota bacterium]|nr:acyloxyacyl hydrolase [Nitrospirota bacterium]